jgi:hypothetical protein
MRFMMVMYPKDYAQVPADAMPDAKLVAAMMKYNEELHRAGVLLALDGLHPPRTGARIRFANGQGTAHDGPFTEAKELIGGYWIVDVKSKDEAVAWALRCPAQDGDTIEVRRVQEVADFPAEVQRELADFNLKN